MNTLSRRAVSFALATTTTYCLATTAHSLAVLHGLSQLGIAIDWHILVNSLFFDLLHLLPGFFPVIVLALLLGFVAMSVLRHRVAMQKKRLSYWVYPLAGALAMLAVHLAIQWLFAVHFIAGARGWGLLAQVGAGFCGGLVYAWSIKQLRKQHKKRRELARRLQTHVG